MKLVLIALALLGAAGIALADDAPLAPGARVRITLLAHPDAPMIGSVLTYRPDSLSFSVAPDSSRRAIARDEVKKLELSRGVHPYTGRGAMIGGIMLGVTFAVLGQGVGHELNGEGSDVTGATGALVGGMIGVIIGAGLGALIGKAEKGERWEEIAP